MVQVDVFWSYGLGATFAVASSRQLLARRRAAAAAAGTQGEKAPAGGSAAEAGVRGPGRAGATAERERSLPEVGTSVLSRSSDPYLLRTLLFLALVFVPSGVWLVWGFPSWETMHVGDGDMPAWLVTLFALTNVTQGVLAYLVVEWLIARGRTYLAYLQIVAGYLGMFFILVHGWDGKGYQRFFSPTREDFLGWNGDWSAWLTSDVALTLYGMGAVLLPVLLLTTAHWHVTGYALDEPDPSSDRRPGRARVMALTLATVFVAALGLAIAAHLAITWLGVPLGIAAAAGVVIVALLPRGPIHALYRAHGLPRAGPAPRGAAGERAAARPAAAGAAT